VSLENARCCATARRGGGGRRRVVGGGGVDSDGDRGGGTGSDRDRVGDRGNDGDSDRGAFRGDLSNTERRGASGSACVS
jgi:hypothetical protein